MDTPTAEVEKSYSLTTSKRSMMNSDQTKALFGMLGELLDRVTRIETRQHRHMKEQGIDPYKRTEDSAQRLDAHTGAARTDPRRG